MIAVPHKLPSLPYPTHALEPYIDRETLELHHQKILLHYIDGLQRVLEGCPGAYKFTTDELILRAHRFPRKQATSIINYAGGIHNHLFYFKSMAIPCDTIPQSPLMQEIVKEFQSYPQFLAQFRKQAMGVFGSGWMWLCYNPGCCRLELLPTQNQLTPLGFGHVPILCVDLWEHAYFLQYQNLRHNYLDGFSHVINWQVASERFEAARAGKH